MRSWVPTSLVFPKTSYVYEAACYGTIASSFALKQVGTPVLGQSNTGEELLNDTSTDSQLHSYKSRIRVQQYLIE